MPVMILSKHHTHFCSSSAKLKMCLFFSFLAKVECFRDALIRFRLGITELKTHRNIYISHVVDNNCPFCKVVEENEYHFLFHCENYETVRPEEKKNNHIKRQKENWKFTEIRLCEEPASTKQLAWFVFKAL